MLSLKVKQIVKQLKKQTAELNLMFREDLQKAQLYIKLIKLFI